MGTAEDVTERRRAAVPQVTGDRSDGDAGRQELPGSRHAHLRRPLPQTPGTEEIQCLGEFPGGAVEALSPLGPMIGQAGVCRRVYTVAAVDVASATLDIDIVVHGESSPMMRWLAGLEPGDRVDFAGPRPHAAPTDATGRIVLLADGSAYPAASAITRALPGVATVILALPEEDPQVSDCADYAADFPGAELRFAASSLTPLSDAFADLDVTATDTVWAAGEREDIRAVRARCLRDLELPKPQVQVFGYWRHGKTGTDADVARLTTVAELQKQGRTLEDDFDVEI